MVAARDTAGQVALDEAEVNDLLHAVE